MPATANLLTRDDTLLGVCQGLGEDAGFNPNWLRVALAAVVLVSPVVALAVYLALGAVVVLARWGWPVVDAAKAAPAKALAADNDERALLARAA